MTKIETAIFDVGGVLIRNQAGSTEKVIQQKLGLSNEQMREIWDYYIPTFGSGKINEAEFWQQVSKRFGVRQVSPEEDLFGRSLAENLLVHQELLDYLAELGQKGLKLAALSDTNPVHAKVLASAGVYAPFDHLFLSHQTGFRKPDPAAYQHVVNVMQIDPASAIFVDDLPQNLVPASELGMYTVLAKNPSQVIAGVRRIIQ